MASKRSHPSKTGRYQRPSLRRDDPAPSRLVDGLTRPIGIVIIMLIFFLIVLTVLMWRDGRFGELWPSRGAILGKASRSWMMGGAEKSRPIDQSAPAGDPSEYDPEPKSASQAPSAPAEPADPAL
jgi:hypothetical protein